jgi:hypothetical protein
MQKKRCRKSHAWAPLRGFAQVSKYFFFIINSWPQHRRITSLLLSMLNVDSNKDCYFAGYKQP